MKRSLLVLLAAIAALCAVSTFAQERTRYGDEFDIQRGTQMPSLQLSPGSADHNNTAVTPTSRTVLKHYLPSPPSGDEYKNAVNTEPPLVTEMVARTAQVTMTVRDGYSQRDIFRVGEDARAPTAPIALKHYLPSPPYGDEYKNLVNTGPAPVIAPVKRATQLTKTINDAYSRDIFLSAAVTRLNMGTGSSLKGYSTGDDLIDAYVVDSSRRYNIDPLLIYSQMSQESSFKSRATSSKGASGLMQLMPETARRLGVADIYDPKQNIEGGVKYMRMLLDMFGGDVALALAGYNAGEGAVVKYGYQIPPYAETHDYVRRISSRYRAISNSRLARTVGRVTN